MLFCINIHLLFITGIFSNERDALVVVCVGNEIYVSIKSFDHTAYTQLNEKRKLGSRIFDNIKNI